MKWHPLVPTALFAALVFWTCTKDDPSPLPQTNLHIRLTDGPGDFQQVNIDVQEVRVKMAGDTSQWILLATNAGVYNLLEFQNGVDTLLASGPVPTTVLKELRLVLGSGNSVMVDSVLYDLDTPSAQQSGLKIKIGKNLGLALDSLTVDFDAEKSIVETGNGKFILKPVLKVKN